MKILFGIPFFMTDSSKLFLVNWLQLYCTVLQGRTIADSVRNAAVCKWQ